MNKDDDLKFNEIFIRPWITFKKHKLQSFLWFIFVPGVSCFTIFFRLLNHEFSELINDIKNGYFYTTSIALMTSILFDLACNCFKNKQVTKNKYNQIMLFIAYPFLFITGIVMNTVTGGKIIIQCILSGLLLILAFWTRLMFLYEPDDYLGNEKQTMDDLEKKSKNVEPNDIGGLRL